MHQIHSSPREKKDAHTHMHDYAAKMPSSDHVTSDSRHVHEETEWDKCSKIQLNASTQRSGWKGTRWHSYMESSKRRQTQNGMKDNNEDTQTETGTENGHWKKVININDKRGTSRQKTSAGQSSMEASNQSACCKNGKDKERKGSLRQLSLKQTGNNNII